MSLLTPQRGLIPDTTLSVTSNVGLPWIPKDYFFPPQQTFSNARETVSQREWEIEIKIQKEGNGERDVYVSVPCRAVQRFCSPSPSYLGPLDLVKVTCQSPVVMWCDAPSPQVPVHLSQTQLARPISVLQILNVAVPPFRPVVPHSPQLKPEAERCLCAPHLMDTKAVCCYSRHLQNSAQGHSAVWGVRLKKDNKDKPDLKLFPHLSLFPCVAFTIIQN